MSTSLSPGAPETPGESDEGAAPRRGWLTVVVQIVGFAVGLGLLGYCGSKALAPENRDQLEKLADAGAGPAMALAGLAVATQLINAVTFWLALAPVQRVRITSVLATHSVAMGLSYLPFKLSMIFRAFIHNRRDGVPLLRAGAWFGAVAAVMLVVIGPLMLASTLHPRVDALWGVLIAGGVVAASGSMVVVARALRDERRWAWFERVVGRAPGKIGSVVRDRLMPRAHEGVRMLADPRRVVASVGLRLVDVAIQSGRLALAAAVVGQPLSGDQAVLAGSVFFLIGVLAPTGQAGVREWGTTGIMAALHSDDLLVAVLMVSAVEAAVVLVLAVAGAAYLRLDRFLWRR